MIVIDLRCDHDHRFEGWFASATAFDQQRADGLLSCPVCNSARVERLPSAPYVQTRASGRELPAPPATVPAPAAPPAGSVALPAEAIEIMKNVLRQAARGAEDVGTRFPDEARRIHYGETEARSIRGAASRDELGELMEEGILVLPVPPDEDLH